MSLFVDKADSIVCVCRFYLVRKGGPGGFLRSLSWNDCSHSVDVPLDAYLMKFLEQKTAGENYADLCSLPDLNETTLLDNLRQRFKADTIYTYVGTILIAINPFKFFPIYNPKYVAMYQGGSHRLGDLPPHIFALANAAFTSMLDTQSDQCIGEYIIFLFIACFTCTPDGIELVN